MLTVRIQTNVLPLVRLASKSLKTLCMHVVKD